MVRPRKGRENGSYEPLTPYERNLKSKKTAQKRRAGNRVRKERQRRRDGVPKQRKTKLQRMRAEKKNRELTRLRVQKLREKRKVIVIE